MIITIKYLACLLEEHSYIQRFIQRVFHGVHLRRVVWLLNPRGRIPIIPATGRRDLGGGRSTIEITRRNKNLSSTN